jgi:hypothetical protein
MQRAELAEFTAELLGDQTCPYTSPGMNPCGLPRVPGLDGCWYHSGANRDETLLERGLARAAEARAMLQEAAPRAAARLAHVALTAEKDRDAIAAASQVLDRVGVSGRQALDVNVEGRMTHVDVTPVVETFMQRLDAIEKRRQAIPATATEREVVIERAESRDVIEIPPIPPPPTDLAETG